MKLNKNFNLENAIREVLAEKCRARCLDDKEDFGAVMEAISNVIERWIDNRCPGCR